VLLHNRNKFSPVPLSHATNRKESYEKMKLLFKKIQYEKYNWNICGDLKVPGLQLGYTNAFCVIGILRTKNITTSTNSGLIENHLFQERKVQ